MSSGSGDRPGSRGGKGRGTSGPGAPGRGRGSSERGGRPNGRRTDPRRSPGGSRGPNRRGREEAERSEVQQRYDGPTIPEEITGRELPRDIAAQLKSLPDKLALRVARHLVAAGRLLEVEPKLAYQHTLAARARASRLAVVREAVGEAAYAAGEYAEALQELRAARRMNGSVEYVPTMADCERALGHPERALTLLRGADVGKLSEDQRAEAVIVEAGARRDRGELEAALRTLERSPLGTPKRAMWVARLRYVYADTLAEAGRYADAVEWFHRAEGVDSESVTDAGERAAELERRLGDE